MNNNSSIKITHENWNIVFNDTPIIDNCICNGYCNYDDREICLSNNLKGTRLMEIFLHECIHAISDIYGICLSEEQVRVLGVSLIQLIRDNNINFLA